MSGTPGDGPGATFLNWVWYPWPEEGVELLERQWDQAVPVWRDLARLALDHGVERIALELHPLHLVYNVPTLVRMREAVGDVIGANVDPSHMFWQQMDPVAVVRALGPAVHHVHLKDTELVAGQVAVAGVLDSRPFEPPQGRAWVFRTIGRSHDARFWADFIAALAEVGYDDLLSIENEDPDQPQAEGVREAAAFIRPLLGE
jgi:sugar phosphate isomerase/epimerase